MASLPTGTVTFVFTDLEGSTRLWQEHPEAMKAALARHDELLRAAVESRDGVVVKTTGDGVHAVFSTAADAVAAAVEAQRLVAGEPWPDTGLMKIRIGVHTGTAELREDDYYGTAVNRAARIMAVAHGGQIVVSHVTEELIRDQPPSGVAALDLGEHRLRDLIEPVRIFQVVHPDLEADFPPLRSLDALPGNLPAQPTELLGREEVLAELTRVAHDVSLVTLTGVGGVGKTRLAIQLAADVLHEFRDGAWLVELAPVLDDDALPDALASPFKLQPRPGQTLTETLVDFLRAKELLLVLDNCEHLLDAVAPVVDRIRSECPHVVVVATSREGLAVRGERIVAVPSLETEDAATLFAARALDARTGFARTADNEETIQRLCERLDGIPLAIELAAARLRSMSAQEVLDRIDRRFRLLTGGSRTALERHRTLQATVDWSYDLLSETERSVFDRLAVFAGGFDLAAAEAVVPEDTVDVLDVFDLLAQLVDKSLVVVDERHGATRYRMLETIRQYAQDRLEETGDAAEARRRHATYYVGMVEDAVPRLFGPEQLEWLDRVWADLDNLRAAMAWMLLAGDADLALRLAVAANVNGTRLSHIALDWADAAVEVEGAVDHPLLPEGASWAAWGAVFHADLERGVALVAARDAAYAASGVEPSAASYQGPGTVALFQGRLDDALELGLQWERASIRDGDDYQLSQSLTFRSGAAFPADPGGALDLATRGAEIARRIGAPCLLSWAVLVLGMLLVEEDPPRAVGVLAEGETLCRLVGNDQGASQILAATALLHLRLGEPEPAIRAARRAWEQAASVGARTTFGQSLAVAFQALADLERWQEALPLQGFADAVFDGFWGAFADARAAALARAEVAIGAPRVDTLTREGVAFNDDEALAFARAAAASVVGEDLSTEGNE